MASDPQNPYRNSAWPQMPQAPFRVRPTPRTAEPAAPEPAQAPEPEPPPQRVAITPLYVRPVDSPPQGLAMGGAVPTATRPIPAPPPQPARPIPADPSPIAVAPQPTRPEPPPPQSAPAGVVELEPLIVEAPRRTPAPVARAKPGRRRVSSTVWATAAVGVAGIVGLAYLLTRSPEPAAQPAPAAIAAAPAAALPTPTATTDATPASVASPPVPTVRQVAVAPRVRAAAPRVAPPAAAAAATEEAASAPVLDLPPAPVAAPPPPPPQPAFTPRAAPDPNAPISTQRPY